MSFNNPFQNKQEESPSVEKMEGKENYKLESGVTINLSWNKFNAENKAEFDPTRVDNPLPGSVIYLPGWAMGSDDETIKKVSHAFAKENETYAITTRSEEAKPQTEAGEKIDFLYEEAIAISKFIKEHNLGEVVIAGHSQGGDKAIDVVSILQKVNPEIKIKGLILVDSVGLYDQTSYELKTNFAKDMIINTPKTLLTKKLSSIPDGLSAANDVLHNIFKEIKRSKSEYMNRFKREVQEMSQINPRMQELKVPIVLGSGAKDIVSNPEKILPPKEELSSLSSREEYLKENYFPNSPYVKMIVPEKLGHHGLPFFRTESVVNAAMYGLKRYNRELEKEKTNE